MLTSFLTERCFDDFVNLVNCRLDQSFQDAYRVRVCAYVFVWGECVRCKCLHCTVNVILKKKYKTFFSLSLEAPKAKDY